MAKNESMDEENMKLHFLTDSIEEMVHHIKIQAIKKIGLTREPYKFNGKMDGIKI